jgi:hypothetical protein
MDVVFGELETMTNVGQGEVERPVSGVSVLNKLWPRKSPIASAERQISPVQAEQKSKEFSNSLVVSPTISICVFQPQSWLNTVFP